MYLLQKTIQIEFYKTKTFLLKEEEWDMKIVAKKIIRKTFN